MPASEQRRRARLLRMLRERYPHATCALRFTNPFELLVATVLSAQSTDKLVNRITPALFKKYPGPAALARADLAELESLIRPSGFFRQKAKNLKACAEAIANDHGGQVPRTMAALMALPGVGRKTANVVLGNAFHLNEGIVVDTHMQRLAQRLGLSRENNPEKIEQELMAIVPQEDWTVFSHRMIQHGREICRARQPKCPACLLAPDCPARQT
ncbi:MAG: endonuclease III [candidate division KSB1 bacterium]|nr:endonuclease III [candidate division KSB1 bacterium]